MIKPPELKNDYSPKYDADILQPWLKKYVVIQFSVLVAITAYFLFNFAVFGTTIKVGMCIWIVYSTVILGLLFERQSWQLAAFEVARVILPATVYGQTFL